MLILEFGDHGEPWSISMGTTASLVEVDHMLPSNVLAIIL